jgi:hypothetical protein
MRTVKMFLWFMGLLVIIPQMGESQQPVSQQPPEHIIKEALRFANGKKLSYRGKRKTAWMECYVFEGDNVEIEIDIVTRKVSWVLYSSHYPVTKRISIDEAEKKVKSWLEEKGINLKDWVLEERKIIGNRYAFYWTKYSPKGVELPCILYVEIEDDEETFLFHRIEREVEISLEPTIKEKEAVKIAIKAAKFNRAKVIKQKLRVWFNNEGKQELQYEIELIQDGLKRTVVINAHTGKIISIFRHGHK